MNSENPATDAKVVPIPAVNSTEEAPLQRINLRHVSRLWMVTLVIGCVFDFLFWKKPVGVNFALFLIVCLLSGLYVLFAEEYRPARNSLWLLLPFTFFAIITFVRQEPLTAFLAYIFTFFSIGLFALTYLGGRWFQYGLSDYFNKFSRLAGGVVYFPIALFFQVRTEQAKRGEGKKQLPIWGVLRGLVIALPIVACFASLLASADVIFGQKLANFLGLFSFGKIGEYSLRLILILMCTYVLAGVILYAVSQSKDEKLISEDNPVIRPFLGFPESAIVLASVSILFVAFVMIQFQYFFGGETNIGITGFTFSEYARRGFNELVIVAFCSLVMILGLSTITQRENEMQKKMYSGLSVGVVILVMVILVSAYQRISLAIDWHGFSRLRLYPRVFLIWLAILLVTVVILESFRLERYFAFASVMASLGFAISLTLVNVDAATVRHNVPRVLQGKNLNVAHLASLSVDAVPALVDEYRSTSYSQQVHEGLGAALTCYLHFDLLPGTYTSDWRSFNLSRWRAHNALQEVQSALQDYGINDKKFPLRVRTPSHVLYECRYYSSAAEE